MKPIRQALWAITLAAPLVWIGTGNADTVTAPAATYVLSSTTSTAPSTTTTTTTLPIATSTTSTLPAGDWRCPQWVPVLLYVGFPESELATADRIIYRESTCRPDAVNLDDPNGGSRGLFQINGIWLDWFLPDRGIAWTGDDLYDPVTNAAAAYAIWERSGWHPWSTY